MKGGERGSEHPGRYVGDGTGNDMGVERLECSESRKYEVRVERTRIGPTVEQL